jgi:hypothetical protein
MEGEITPLLHVAIIITRENPHDGVSGPHITHMGAQCGRALWARIVSAHCGRAMWARIVGAHCGRAMMV